MIRKNPWLPVFCDNLKGDVMREQIFRDGIRDGA
jgi:hypothetical protein